MAVPFAPTQPAASFKKRVVQVAERWRASHASADAVDSVKRFYAAIQAPEKLYENNEPTLREAAEAVSTLQEAAHLFTFAADPTKGLLAELFRVKERHMPLALLKALGADGVVRAKSVDKVLVRMLGSAVHSPSQATALLARVPKQLRPLLALRFFSISGFDFCLAAESIQTGIEVVLLDDISVLCDSVPGTRDACVDEFCVAMDVLRDTMPKSKILQSALDAALAHRRTPPDCLDAFSDITDNCVCPDMSWLFALKPPGNAADADADADADEEEVEEEEEGEGEDE
jgi:hypothetical protein